MANINYLTYLLTYTLLRGGTIHDFPP